MRAANLGETGRLSIKDCFRTFPPPGPDSDRWLDRDVSLAEIGRSFHTMRKHESDSRGLGYTSLLNLYHDPSCTDDTMQALRKASRQMDEEVLDAYGWSDLKPGLRYDFVETASGRRFAIDPDTRAEVLSRLLALNHERAEEEAATS